LGNFSAGLNVNFAINEVRMRKSRKWALLAFVAVILVGGAWGFVRLNGAAPTIDPSKVAVVERGTMTRSVVATGKVEPITKVEIKSKANGIIERLLVEVDQIVDAGRVLAELDKENLTARLREARANLQAAEAAREAAIAQLRKNEIEAEAPDVEFARRNNTRAQQLFDQKLVSQSSLDDAKSALELAENRKRAASGQLVIAQAKVVEATANVAQARAAVERAEEELANSTIKAPIRATVLTRDVEIGSPVSSILNLGANATLVMTLGDIQQVFVRGKVDEADIGRVRLGQAARITTESFPDKVFEGRVTQISPIGVEKDNVTTFEVKVSIDNAAKELKANMTANAEIVLEELPESLIVPEAAVTYDPQRNAFVDVVDPASARGRRRVGVKVGVGNGTRIQVMSGLKQGDRIVLPG
jgi:HlyD family secretion protein